MSLFSRTERRFCRSEHVLSVLLLCVGSPHFKQKRRHLILASKSRTSNHSLFLGPPTHRSIQKEQQYGPGFILVPWPPQPRSPQFRGGAPPAPAAPPEPLLQQNGHHVTHRDICLTQRQANTPYLWPLGLHPHSLWQELLKASLTQEFFGWLKPYLGTQDCHALVKQWGFSTNRPEEQWSETRAPFPTELTCNMEKGTVKNWEGSLPFRVASKAAWHSEDTHVLSATLASVFKFFVAFIGAVLVSKTT